MSCHCGAEHCRPPPGTVFVAVSHGDDVDVRQAAFVGKRAEVRAATVRLALEMLGNIPR